MSDSTQTANPSVMAAGSADHIAKLEKSIHAAGDTLAAADAVESEDQAKLGLYQERVQALRLALANAEAREVDVLVTDHRHIAEATSLEEALTAWMIDLDKRFNSKIERNPSASV